MRIIGDLSRAIVVACAGVSVLCALPSTADADLIVNPNKYCSAGANHSSTGDTVPGSLLSVNDLKLTISGPAPQYTAADCYGAFDPGNSSPTNETAALNKIFGDISGPDQLFYLDKYNYDNTDAPNSVTGLGGITFVIQTTGGQNGAPGSWTLVWTDTNGTTPSNLPLIVDFAFLLNGGNNNAAYLLTDVLLPVSPALGTGSFDIQFLNRGEQQPTISHLLVAGRIVSSPTTTIKVPEPASMAMFGTGLVGLWAFGRRRRWRR